MGCGTSSARNVKEVKKNYITSYDKFFAAITKGSKLVVVDNKVVDVTEIIPIHGGGSEQIENLVGTLKA